MARVSGELSISLVDVDGLLLFTIYNFVYAKLFVNVPAATLPLFPLLFGSQIKRKNYICLKIGGGCRTQTLFYNCAIRRISTWPLKSSIDDQGYKKSDNVDNKDRSLLDIKII